MLAGLAVKLVIEGGFPVGSVFGQLFCTVAVNLAIALLYNLKFVPSIERWLYMYSTQSSGHKLPISLPQRTVCSSVDHDESVILHRRPEWCAACRITAAVEGGFKS